MKNLKFLFLLLLAFSFSCVTDDNASEEQEQEQEVVGFSTIKNDTWRDHLGEEFEAEGILVVENQAAKILVSADDYYVDGLLDEQNYIHINLNSDLENEVNLWEHYGKKVKITGTLEVSNNESYLSTSQILGDISLASLLINNVSGLQILDPSIYIVRPELYNICTRYPQLCEVEFSQENKTALIYSGGINDGYAYLRYWNDVKLMYSILLDKGYPEENIRVVYKNGIGEDSDIPVHYAANQTGLNNAFTYLGSRMNNSTKFFLMMNNHGGGNDTYSTRYGNSGVTDSDGDDNRAGINDNVDEQFFYYNSSTALTDDFLASKINELPMGSMIAVVKPCYSGGVIWDFKGPNRVIMTSGTEFQVTYSHTSGQFGEFTYHFFAAVTGKDPLTGNTVNADLNADGNISMYEAQVYILANDARNEQPQYEDDNDGVGTSSPSASGVGASTYL
ncbi:hypothetical protein KO494_07710 [Lacinutrix sp. C3R15]|uniref:hypothetical protein n=1 Tax=Flavobacteriaceae TaxID=49546 RepID=UPI001C0807BC|nr:MULTISPECIES: hypothetical protein [Flavobacteriaceae]MBU2939424.1 hypothetical protein [Lacinutrix sp. C3R15]MDO6622739.1 hypothetical protein [Oceanihabitans sp. 1_MG-2023]